MKKKKLLTMTVHIPPRGTHPLSSDERKQLAELFAALMDLDSDKNVIKGNMYAEQHKQHSDNVN